MKTVQISDESYEFIKNLAEQMEKQDNRATRCPIWCVFHKDERWVDDDDEHDKIIWLDDDYYTAEEISCDDWDDTKADEYDELYGAENRRAVKVIDEIDMNNGNAIFLTQQGYDDYIKRQGYHHEQPFSYVHSAWNNRELEKIMLMMFEIMGKPVPMAYK